MRIRADRYVCWFPVTDRSRDGSLSGGSDVARARVDGKGGATRHSGFLFARNDMGYRLWFQGRGRRRELESTSVGAVLR
jgi:hypothetical protein